MGRTKWFADLLRDQWSTRDERWAYYEALHGPRPINFPKSDTGDDDDED